MRNFFGMQICSIANLFKSGVWTFLLRIQVRHGLVVHPRIEIVQRRGVSTANHIDLGLELAMLAGYNCKFCDVYRARAPLACDVAKK